MKLVVKVLLLGLSVNAIKLEQKSKDEVCPLAVEMAPLAVEMAPLAVEVSPLSVEMSPLTVGVSPELSVTFDPEFEVVPVVDTDAICNEVIVVPECHECEEEVEKDCFEIQDAIDEKWAAQRATAMIKHESDVAYKQVKAQDLANIEAAKEYQEDESDAADEELTTVKKQAAAEVTAAKNAHVIRKRAADKALDITKTSAEDEMKIAFKTNFDEKIYADEELRNILTHVNEKIVIAERQAAERKVEEKAFAIRKNIKEIQAKDVTQKAASEAGVAKAKWDYSKAKHEQANDEADAAELEAFDCTETSCV